MTAEIESAEVKDGVLQLRYLTESGDDSELNAALLAEAIQGLVEFTSELANSGAFGSGAPPELKIRPISQGSFLVDAVITWSGANPEAAVGLTVYAGDLLIRAFASAKRMVQGAIVTDYTDLENGYVKLNWSDGDVDEVSIVVWKALKSKPKKTRRALKKILAPMSDDAYQLELRAGRPEDTSGDILEEPSEVVADRSDYRILAAEPEDIEERVEIFTTEAELLSVDFRTGEKWRIRTPEGSRLVDIEDNDFLIKIERGLPLHKGDVLDVEIRENVTITNGRRRTEWTILKAQLRRRGDGGQSD